MKREVLLEFHQNGAYLRCCAIDPISGEEAVAMGAASNRLGVEKLAILKLENRLAELDMARKL